MSSKLMEVEAGGESTQYESIRITDKPHSKEDGQFEEKIQPGLATSQTQTNTAAEADKTAKNGSYSQPISEGVDGMRTGANGSADNGTFGSSTEQNNVVEARESREAQGYGLEPDVGA